MEQEHPEKKKSSYIANQFIHACTSFVARDRTRNWCDVLQSSMHLVQKWQSGDSLELVPCQIFSCQTFEGALPLRAA